MRRELALFLGLALAACGRGGSSDTCDANLLPGDLVITEIHANPEGTDTGKEWFEVYNASSSAIDLSGVTLLSSRSDGTGERTHTMAAVTIQPGQFLVLGGVLHELRAAYVDYGYADELGDLRNTEGRLAVRCNDVDVDEVSYTDMASGVAQGLSGANPPDYLANDDTTNWCGATELYDTADHGSPGESNEVCPGAGPPGTCVDVTGSRPVVAPVVGDLVITEFMANPSSGRADDATGEWFEVEVMTDVDLNGLELGTTPGTVRGVVSDAACVRVAAGERVVFARSSDPTKNGMLSSVDRLFSFGLTNSGGALFIGYDGAPLDSISWSTTGDGASTALDPGNIDETTNDDALMWCRGTVAYGLGDLGTPGTLNTACPVVVPSGMCLDGTTLRDIVPPAVGEIVINEIMPDPTVAGDSAGEWIELAILADVDLNDLQIGTTPPTVKTTIRAAECLRRTNGSFVLLARKDTGNGGLPMVEFTFNFDVANPGGSLFVGHSAAILDETMYGSATPGKSWSLPPSKLDPAMNDLATDYCLARDQDVYGPGPTQDHGTPAMGNPACP